MNKHSSQEVKICPYVETYKFNVCGITTCKNHTIKTESNCLELDRVKSIGNKIISDSELNLYKFTSKKVSTRLVSMKRKEAVDRVKCLLILRELLEYIIKNYGDEEETLPLVTGKYIRLKQTTYPLKIRKLRFKNWMWYRITDPEVYQNFIKHQPGGDCKNYSVEQLLHITELKYTKLLKEIEESKNGR
jgi:hypothetical protein